MPAPSTAAVERRDPLAGEEVVGNVRSPSDLLRLSVFAVVVVTLLVLVAAGMDNAVAVPGVFLYRLATFWVPILPGWFSFTYLQRSEYV